MKFPKLRATFMALLATTALAACAGGVSGIPHVSGNAAMRQMKSMTTPMSIPCPPAKDISSAGALDSNCMGQCPPGMAPVGTGCGTSGTGGGGVGPPPGWNNCVIGCNPGNPGDPINGGPPCQPISSCIAYTGKPKQGIHCDGAQFAVGDPVSPGNDNANNTAFYVNTEAGLWQNGQVVGYLYQGTYSANGTGQSFFGIQITNNASWNFGATIGTNFGPIDVGVGGGYGVNDVSHVQWWDGKLPLGVNASNCWGSYPVQGT